MGSAASIEQALEGRTTSLTNLGDDYAIDTTHLGENPTNQC
jgi:hypothetical protein